SRPEASLCGRSVAFRRAAPSLSDPENVAFGRERHLARGAGATARTPLLTAFLQRLVPCPGEETTFAEPFAQAIGRLPAHPHCPCRAADHAELRQCPAEHQRLARGPLPGGIGKGGLVDAGRAHPAG